MQYIFHIFYLILFRKFEKSYQVKTEDPNPSKGSDEGVALCDICNRIFLSQEALRNHTKEHKKEKKKAKEETRKSVTPSPRSKRTPAPIEENTETPASKRKMSDAAGLDCFKCGKDCKNKMELRHHVLTHFYADFYSCLPSSKPFSCPVCCAVSRDRISLVRHYAFVHEVGACPPPLSTTAPPTTLDAAAL